jgi:hypothetical protein
MASAIDPIATGGAAKVLQDIGGATPALLDGGNRPQQVVPGLADRLERDVVHDEVGERRRYLQSARDVRPPIAQTIEPRTQSKAQRTQVVVAWRNRPALFVGNAGGLVLALPPVEPTQLSVRKPFTPRHELMQRG